MDMEENPSWSMLRHPGFQENINLSPLKDKTRDGRTSSFHVWLECLKTLNNSGGFETCQLSYRDWFILMLKQPTTSSAVE